MKLKKILCIALALTLAMAIFAGCKNDDNPSATQPSKINTAAPGGNKVVDPNKPANTQSAPIGTDTRKITPEPSTATSAEPTTVEASQSPVESATPEASATATDAGSGN